MSSARLAQRVVRLKTLNHLTVRKATYLRENIRMMVQGHDETCTLLSFVMSPFNGLEQNMGHLIAEMC